MPDPTPTPTPVLPNGAQLAVSRAVTISVNVAMTWLVSRGLASQEEATQWGLILAGVLVGAVGNAVTLLWSYVRRQWLERQPAPEQVAAAVPPKITLDVEKLTDLIEPMVVKALDDALKTRLAPLLSQP